MIHTHVAQRPVAHQSAAVEAQASDRTNVLTGLPNNYAEGYRGKALTRVRRMIPSPFAVWVMMPVSSSTAANASSLFQCGLAV